MNGSIIEGKNVDLYFLENGYNFVVAHATNFQINTTAPIQETTTKNNLKGTTFDYVGKYSWKLVLSEITNLIDVVNIATFQRAILESTKLTFIGTDVNNIEWTGTVLITSTDTDSPFNAVSNSTVEMQGDGELGIISDNIPVPPAGSSVTIIDQLAEILAIVPAPGTYQVLKFNNIDCGHAVQNNPLIIMQAN